MLLLKRPPKEVSWWLTNVVPLWRVPYEEVGNGQRIVEQKTDFMMDTKTSRACELDQVWPDLAKFCHWQNLQDFGNIWRAYLVLATFWTYFGKIMYGIGQSFIVVNGPNWKQKLAIWSHCKPPVMTESFIELVLGREQLWIIKLDLFLETEFNEGTTHHVERFVHVQVFDNCKRYGDNSGPDNSATSFWWQRQTYWHIGTGCH